MTNAFFALGNIDATANTTETTKTQAGIAAIIFAASQNPDKVGDLFVHDYIKGAKAAKRDVNADSLKSRKTDYVKFAKVGALTFGNRSGVDLVKAMIAATQADKPKDRVVKRGTREAVKSGCSFALEQGATSIDDDELFEAMRGGDVLASDALNTACGKAVDAVMASKAENRETPEEVLNALMVIGRFNNARGYGPLASELKKGETKGVKPNLAFIAQ